MHYKFKSINCNSCAASLIKKADSNISKCSYCRNTNLILEDGKTKIIEDIIEAKPIIEKKQSIFFYIMLFIGFGIIPMVALLLFKKSKEKENKYTNDGAVLQKM